MPAQRSLEPAPRQRPAGAAGSAWGAAPALRYLATSPVLVRGPATGAEYRFSAAQPVQRVARADCEALLRTLHFALQP